MSKQISALSKIILVVAAGLLITSLFVPLWSIYLDAPQYPEGLSLKIKANTIGGDVDIINGLNHYIGMKTLHTEDFIEFTVLPYIIIIYALLFLVAAFVGRKKWLYVSFAAFVFFGIIAMVDFWRWEYNYGHNLDPNAAIVVPGMSYQPPLIGFKQLLNFGAYSIPDTGGWLLAAAGAILLAGVLIEIKKSNKRRGLYTNLAVIVWMMVSISSCNNKEAEPVRLNSDACEYCKMTIADIRFVAEIITKKGRVYKFDDIRCMVGYTSSFNKADIQKYYISSFSEKDKWIDATTAWYVCNTALRSPMGGNAAAFPSEDAASKLADTYKTNVLHWNDLSNISQDNHGRDEQGH